MHPELSPSTVVIDATEVLTIARRCLEKNVSKHGLRNAKARDRSLQFLERNSSARVIVNVYL